MTWGKFVVVVALAGGLTGCASGLAELMKAGADNDASVCASVSSVYGIVKFARTNIANGTVKCDQEGMTVKSIVGDK